MCGRAWCGVNGVGSRWCDVNGGDGGCGVWGGYSMYVLWRGVQWYVGGLRVVVGIVDGVGKGWMVYVTGCGVV